MVSELCPETNDLQKQHHGANGDLTPPKNHVQIFENPNLNSTIQTPIQHTTFHHSFTKYLYFLRYRPICPSMSIIFHPFKFILFDLENPKIQTSYFSSSYINLKPNKTKKNKLSLFDPHLDYEIGVHMLLADTACR